MAWEDVIESTTTAGGWEDVSTQVDPNQPIAIPQPTAPEFGEGALGQAVSDVGSAFKGTLGQIGSLATAIPANIAELVGVDASGIRDSQAYWQNLTQEARDELTKTYGDSELAKSALFAAANPVTFAGGSPLALAGAGATLEAADIAASGGGTGVTVEDVGDVATAAGLDLGIGKVIDTVVPAIGKSVKTRYGELIDRLPVDAKKKATKALDKIDEVGGKDLSEETRGKLLNDLDLSPDSAIVDSQIKASLVKAERASYQKSNDAYKIADEVGKTTNTVDTRNSVDILSKNADGELDIPRKVFKKKFKAYREIKDILETNPEVNAKGIEDKLKVLKEDQRAAKSNVSYLYSRAIDDLETQQRQLLSDAGIPDAYTEARGLWQDWKRDFKGDISGTGVTGGKSIDSVLTAQNNFDVSQNLLSGKIDPNLAEQVGKNFSGQEKKDMVFNVLSKGIDEQDVLNTPENVNILLNNFKSSDSRGLRIMLGAEGFKDLRKNMNALIFVQEAIKRANKEDAGIGKDVLELGAAAAAMKISPYAAVHVAINKSRNIIDRALFRDEKNRLIKRVKGIKDASVRNRLLKAIGIMTPINTREEE